MSKVVAYLIPPASVLGTLKLGISLLVTYLILGAIRRVYFHPLSKFKGPRYLAITNLVHIRLVLRGRWVHHVLAWHEKYGPVIRVAPNEISYIDVDAWNDIYKAHRGQEQLKKYMPSTPSDAEPALFNNPSDAEHALIRKVLSPVMSDRGVRDREDMLLKHVGQLTAELNRAIERSPTTPVDLWDWYGRVTFDIVGEAVSDEDFGVVADSDSEMKYRHILENTPTELKGLAIGTAFERNPITRHLIVKRVKRAPLAAQRRLAEEKIEQYRKSDDKQAKHVVSMLVKNVDTDQGLTPPRAMTVTADMIFAGTDTVATVLTAATYLLLRNPDKLRILRDEVRSKFTSADAITLTDVNALTYQNAVIMETMRLCPPGPETTRRKVTPGGKIISGEWIPEGTLVGVYHWTAGRYSRAWKDADSFVPERWLPDNEEYKDDHRGVINPYNIGPRNCVGQVLANAELRLILAAMVVSFDMSLDVGDTSDWLDFRIWGLMGDKRPLVVHLRPASKLD